MSHSVLRLDEEGRICLPEQLRKVLGWEEGTLVTAEVAEAGQLTLRPLESEPVLLEKEGILVVRSRSAVDAENELTTLRAERLDDLSGMPK